MEVYGLELQTEECFDFTSIIKKRERMHKSNGVSTGCKWVSRRIFRVVWMFKCMCFIVINWQLTSSIDFSVVLPWIIIMEDQQACGFDRNIVSLNQLFIYPFSTAYPVRGCRLTGVYLSIFGQRWGEPSQVTSSTQGWCMETNNHPDSHSHLWAI